MASENLKKPTATKLISILIIVKLVIASIFIFVLASGTSIGGSDASRQIAITFVCYVVLAVPILYFNAKKKLKALRLCLVIDFLVSLPGRAVIGLIISGFLFFITFRKSVKSYFEEASTKAGTDSSTETNTK